MDLGDLKQGQLCHYRPVAGVPCEPVVAYFVEESGARPGRALIDCGATGYAAPYDRDRRVVWPAQLVLL